RRKASRGRDRRISSPGGSSNALAERESRAPHSRPRGPYYLPVPLAVETSAIPPGMLKARRRLVEDLENPLQLRADVVEQRPWAWEEIALPAFLRFGGRIVGALWRVGTQAAIQSLARSFDRVPVDVKQSLDLEH